MKKKLILAICFILVGVNSFAEQEQRHSLEAGTGFSHRKYVEPNVMEQKGIMSNIFGSYTYRNNFMLRAEGMHSLGQVDYRSVRTGTMDNINDYMFEFRGLAGYDFALSGWKEEIITPYFGIGYRYLNDDMGGRYTSTNAFGYERESTYIYSPIGIKAMIEFENQLSVGITGEYDYFWNGTQKSHMGWQSGYYDIENDQDEGFGFRCSVEFEKKGKKVNYVIEPFVTYWDIKDSKITTDPGGNSWIEPKNHTEEFGIKLAAKF